MIAAATPAVASPAVAPGGVTPTLLARLSALLTSHFVSAAPLTAIDIAGATSALTARAGIAAAGALIPAGAFTLAAPLRRGRLYGAGEHADDDHARRDSQS